MSSELLTPRRRHATAPAGGSSLRPTQVALPVAAVRRVEAQAMAALAPGALMARAAAALAVVVGRELRDRTGGVAGRRVVLLVGSGDNGGDALYAGGSLARRGVRVDALTLADRWHRDGADALRAAGGTLRPAAAPGAGELLDAADLVVDGILGIGGRGGLREPASSLLARVGSTPVVAVDLPSGIDADTGAVPGTAVHAARTVVMGVLKPGLLLEPGASLAGRLTVVDIGLELPDLPESVRVVDDALAAAAVPRPGAADDKYTRGVVGVTAGSSRYPGAALLCTGAARHGPAGYVRYAGSAAPAVVDHWPDVVAADADPADAGRVQCWVAGPGRGTDDAAARAVAQVLDSDVPVVLDADAITLLAQRAELRRALARPAVTLLTPHAGEFERLREAVGSVSAVAQDRVAATRALAAALGVVVLLKGATTLVAAPDGALLLVRSEVPELATAGTGDVLSGLLGATLAHAHAGAQAERAGTRLDLRATALAAAGAAYVHGVAGRLAAAGGRTVAALDVLAALPGAVAAVRAAAGAG